MNECAYHQNRFPKEEFQRKIRRFLKRNDRGSPHVGCAGMGSLDDSLHKANHYSPCTNQSLKKNCFRTVYSHSSLYRQQTGQNRSHSSSWLKPDEDIFGGDVPVDVTFPLQVHARTRNVSCNLYLLIQGQRIPSLLSGLQVPLQIFVAVVFQNQQRHTG